ncbi:tumor protein p53-inducible nuclear protein 2 [Conger conger]|uniref:tumor protein p53-inducible nuclear protein 2 n=1 Tax=Conger conger TaxID=82655 RepID=UPI002A5ACEA5|nr:tumor protein p53-inducible nuclear protein 2 [Conger conger]XP_061101095.1 tumor protein p53-inducible nuclear protein 2 [Conger conger]
MIRKVLALFGAGDEDDINVNDVEDNESCEDLIEYEDGDWVIINVHEGNAVSLPEVDPLENLLIEHPSMSVYQLTHQRGEDDDLGSDQEEEEDEDSARPVPVRHSAPCRAGVLQQGRHFRAVQRARAHVERRTLTRTALCRQSLAKTRYCPSVKRYGYFKQPCQRFYNY